MSELIQRIERLENQNNNLIKSVHDLTVLVMKNKVSDTWIDEEVAASMLGYKNTRSLRNKIVLSQARIEKGEKVPYPLSVIQYRSTNGRAIQYNLKSIQKYQQLTSTAQS